METKKSTARKYGYPEVTNDNNEEIIVNLKITNKHNNYKRDNYKHKNYKHGTGQDRCTTGPDRTSATLFNTWQFRWIVSDKDSNIIDMYIIVHLMHVTLK